MKKEDFLTRLSRVLAKPPIWLYPALGGIAAGVALGPTACLLAVGLVVYAACGLRDSEDDESLSKKD